MDILLVFVVICFFFFFKQKTAYEMRISDWSSDVCSSDLLSGQEPTEGEVRVNHPLELAGDRVYLMGNGYAPTITIRDAEGQEIYRNSVPFLPQDNNMTSLGVIKVADGLPEQIGLIGFFYPTMQPLESGACTSIYGDLQ